MNKISLPLLLSYVSAILAMAMIFILKTYADTSFLVISGADHLPHLLAGQAALMMLVAFVYSRSLSLARPIVFDVLFMLLSIAMALMSPSLLEYGSDGAFAVALMLLTFPAMANLSLWNSLQNIVQGRKLRVFLPKLGAAATAGSVLGSLGSVQLTQSYGVESLTFAGAFCGILLIFIRFYLYQDLVEKKSKVKKVVKEQASKDKCGRMLIYFLIASVLVESLVAGLIDYGFKYQMSQHYSLNELATAFALFYAAANATMFVVQIVGVGQLLSTRPLSETLVLTPAILLLASVAWLVLPSLWVILFARYSDTIFRFSFSRAALEISLSPLSKLANRRWKIILKGGISQGGTVIVGLLLIPSAAYLNQHDFILPSLLIGLVMIWIVMQIGVSRGYLAILSNSLGKGSFNRSNVANDWTPDQAATSKVIDLLSTDNEEELKFASRVLKDIRSSHVLPYLMHDSKEIRIKLYVLLEERPVDKRCIEAISAAVAKEDDTQEDVFIAGLHLLSHYENPSEKSRALAILGETKPADMDDLQLVSAIYLLRAYVDLPMEWTVTEIVNALISHQSTVSTMPNVGLLLKDLFYAQALTDDQLMTAGVFDCALSGNISQDDAFLCFAHVGSPMTMELLVENFLAGLTNDEQIFKVLEDRGLSTFLNIISDLTLNRIQRRDLAFALRYNDSDIAEYAIYTLLRDENASVRLVAARTLLYKKHGGTALLSKKIVYEVIFQQLERFSFLLQARKPHAQQTSLLDLEIERFISDKLTELTGLFSLLGDPGTLTTAERGLKSNDESTQLQTLDAIQEVVPFGNKKQMLGLLELYIYPQEPTQFARNTILDIEWLQRCEDGSLASMEPVLMALRKSELFRDIEGENLLEIAKVSLQQLFSKDDVIIYKDDIGEQFYVVVEGAVRVEMDGKVLRVQGSGETFGELALLNNVMRSASVIAESDCLLLEISQENFTRILQLYPDVGIGVARVLAQWLRKNMGA